VPKLKPTTDFEIIFIMFVNIVQAFVAGCNIGTLYSLKMLYFYRNISEQCRYCLYVFGAAHWLRIIKEYIYLKCADWTAVCCKIHFGYWCWDGETNLIKQCKG
jgi:hypothetical protein